jgi:prolyl oligopeptidase
MKFSKLVLILLIFCSFLYSQSIDYPESKKDDQVDDYFGVKVQDPYRWLEDDTSKETAEWVKAQNAVTFNYLDIWNKFLSGKRSVND